MLIELVRLLVTLTLTAAGFMVGREAPGWFATGPMSSDFAVVLGSLLGAGIGYIGGGLLGRFIRAGLDRAPGLAERTTGPQLFAGAFGMVAGLLVGVVAGIPLVLLTPPIIGWPVAALVILILAAAGARVFAARAHDLLAAVGLRPRRPGADPVAEGGFIIDTSAAIDGRVLELARAGLVAGPVWVPEFVLDELQGIADASARDRRRRGRRGLEVLEALRDLPGVDLQTIEAEVPEFAEVDAKLLALCREGNSALISTDSNLARAAALRGVRVVNPHALGESLRPLHSSGDRLSLKVEREGSEPGQGVGYLDDGTMVVVEGGAGLVGSMVDVEVAGSLRTAMGRMVFARVES